MRLTGLIARGRASVLLRNVFAVASGAALAQVIVIAFSPLITRIYSPEAFGLQGVFLSLVSILSPVIALRYPMAIVTATTEDQTLQIARLSLIVAGIMAGLLWAVLGLGGAPLLALLGAADLGALIYLLPLALFFVALQDVTDYRAARLGAFGLVGRVSVMQALLANAARVAGGLVAPVSGVLVGVTTLAPAAYALMMRTANTALRGGSFSLSRADAKRLLRANRDFPFYRMPTDVLNAVSQVVPVILLAALFDPAAAGLYVLARSVTSLPLNVLGTAMGNVLYAKFADLARAGLPLFPLAIRASVLQLAIPSAALLVASLYFPRVFAVVFGEDWRAAGEYARWMTLFIIGMLVNVPSVRALPVIGRQGWHLLFNSIIMLAGLTGLCAAYLLVDTPLAAVAGYSLASGLAYAAQIGTYLTLIRLSDRKESALDR